MALPPLNRQRLRDVFLIFNYLLVFLLVTEGLPLDGRNFKRSQSHHKRQVQNNNASGQIYPAESLIPKITKQLDDPRQSAQPQFVANNGPLIRMPDGQFVLAPSVSEQQNRPQPLQTNQQLQQQSTNIAQQENKGMEHGSESSSSLSSSPEVSPTSTPESTTLPTETTISNENELQTSSPFSPTISSTNSPTHIPSVDKSVDLDGDGALSLNEVQYAANVDSDHNGLLSLHEAKAYILREYGISNRDVERIWRLVVPSSGDEMDAVLFSKLRRRVRGMSIRLARQIMKTADRDQDGHIDMREAAMIAFEQEGIGAGEVVEMLASVDDNNDGQLNAPEFADFERIVRAKAVETSKKALKVVDTDGSGTLTMDEAKKIAFDHYGFDEATLEPFFAQADENEDGQLDAVEFAGFRSVIRGRAVKNALMLLPEMDEDGDGSINEAEAEQRARREDDMNGAETHSLFAVADQDRNGLLDKVELADFVRLVRLTSIKFVSDHFRDYDTNRDKQITLDELERLVKDRYKLEPTAKKQPPPTLPPVIEETRTTTKTVEITTINSDLTNTIANTKTTDSSNSQEEEGIENIGEEGKTKEKLKQVEQTTNQTNNVVNNVLENNTTIKTSENSLAKMSGNETIRQSTTNDSQLMEEKQNNKIVEENSSVVRDKNESQVLTTNTNIQTTQTLNTTTINLQTTTGINTVTNVVNNNSTIEANKEQVSTKKQKKRRRKGSTTAAPTTTTTTAAEESYGSGIL
uniref:Calmodulin n=1 Tax=Meloidogyne hapla TaxID=6305 RepID=A0A1I8BRE8_MELHA